MPPVVDDDTGDEDDDDSTDFSSAFSGSIADAFSNGSGFSLSRRASLGSLNPNPKEFVPGASVAAPPLPPPTPDDDGEVDAEIVDGAGESSPVNEDVMQNEDSFFWSVAYEVRFGSRTVLTADCRAERGTIVSPIAGRPSAAQIPRH